MTSKKQRESSKTNEQRVQVLLAGHVVIDEIIDRVGQKVPRVSLGGGASYGSIVLKSLGYSCELITKAGADFPAKFGKVLLRHAGVNVSDQKVVNSKTTRYRIDRSGNERKLWLISRCRTLSKSDFTHYFPPDKRPETVILNPVAGELPLELLQDLTTRFGNVIADSQGFVRNIAGSNSEISMNNGMNVSMLSGLAVLKADIDELKAWTGLSDKDSAITVLSRYVRMILFTSGSDVVELYKAGKLVVRAFPFAIQAADTTGAGDILLASFGARYFETGNVDEALAFATCAASLAVRNKGILKARLSKEEIEKNVKNVKIER